MELSNPTTPISVDATSRRKSRRNVQKPVFYQQDPKVSIGSVTSNGSGKRKRAAQPEATVDAEISSDETSPDEEESDPDEEELKEQRRRATSTKKSQNRPAPKRSKILTAGTTNLVMRPASNGVKRAFKPRKPRARQNFSRDEATGLYGKSS